MMHKQRAYVVVDVETQEQLAGKLCDYTWCGCNGFRLSGFLFLNDSTCADGAQEYGVVREADRMQLESVTFGWMKKEEALAFLTKFMPAPYETFKQPIENRIQTPAEHQTCAHCA